jgi:hypothetical protein
MTPRPHCGKKNRQMSSMARELIETNPQLRGAATRLSELVEEYQEKYSASD